MSRSYTKMENLAEEVFRRIEKDDILPTTAQVIRTRFEEVYKKYLDEGIKSEKALEFIVENAKIVEAKKVTKKSKK